MAVKVEEALELIYENTHKKSTKILPIESALAYVLAEDIVAEHNLPPFDNSAMDGYAVKLEDSAKTVKLSHTIFAGDNSDAILACGNAIKIMTGARVPVGCECIVPQEDTMQTPDGDVTLPANLQSMKHIRFCGEDIKAGKTLLLKGERLHAHHLTLLSSQGITHVKVFKKPRVSLFASGSELKMHFEKLKDYQLYNTNTPTFYSRAQELGCEVEFIGTAVDTLEDIQAHIQSALDDSDLIITSGGVSVGDADFTKEAFGAFGYEILFEKVEIKPGKPTTVGKVGNTMILNLPGNPLAASLNFELFGKSIILALSGSKAKYQNVIKAKMKKDYKLKAGRRTLVPGVFDGEFFEPIEKFAPGMVSPLASANSYIMIDESCGLFACGNMVNVISTRFEFTSEEMVHLVSKH